MTTPHFMSDFSRQGYITVSNSYSTDLDDTQRHPPGSQSAPRPPPEPSVLEILRMAAFRGDLTDIPQRISDAVTGHNPRANQDTLRVLLRCLAELGIDFEHAHQAISGTRTLSCPRCTRIYRDVDNGPDACTVRHEPPLVTVARHGAFQTKCYPCCGLVTTTARPDSEHAGSGACYVGPHASLDDFPPLTPPNACANSNPGSLPQPAMPATNVNHATASANASYSRFPSWVARRDTSHASLQATSTTVNSAASESAPAATLAEPGRAIPIPCPVRQTPTMADAHPTAAQWWTEAPLSFAFPCTDSSLDSSSCWNADGDAFAAAMRVPAPEVPITTIPWEESNLYHPPGCMEVPAARRDKPSASASAEVETKPEAKVGLPNARARARARRPPLCESAPFSSLRPHVLRTMVLGCSVRDCIAGLPWTMDTAGECALVRRYCPLTSARPEGSSGLLYRVDF